METLLPIPTDSSPALDAKLGRDLKILAIFIELYCQHNHKEVARDVVNLRTHDVKRIAGREITLCPGCTQLLTHAFVKRSHCPMSPKPACKHCPVHCYHPRYRAAISEVMRFSGQRMVMRGRLDYLLHLLF